jgi:hypothetical protein
MARVILHARQPLDDASDARQGPEVRAEPMRARPLAQGRFDPGQLLRRQSRPPAGAARRPQRWASPPAPRAVPAHDALAAGAQAPSDGALRLSARGKQPRGLLATNFQSVEIPPWPLTSWHALIVRRERWRVTVLREIQ